jgi:hypothetical protein
MRWLSLLLLALVTLPAYGELALRGIAPPVTGKAVVINVRPAALCQTRSVAGARCLPAAEFLDGRGQLAPWREILWLFTTVRLDGRETVVVIGDEATDRRFVAGLLWLAGQRRVELIEQPVAALLAAARRRGAMVACFFINDGVLVVADPEIKGALGDVRAVACEESWRRFRPHEACPIEAGSQTDNSALMAQAQRVVSL